MTKKMLIDATHPEETRVVVVDGTKVEDFDFESAFKRQLAGNIYLAKVTRVEPSLQAAFIDYGGNRHGFLAFGEIHPDYYQIPVADRQALLAEERAIARGEDEGGDDEEASESGRRRDDRRRRGQGQGRGQARALAREGDAVARREAEEAGDDDAPAAPSEVHPFGEDAAEGLSPMTTVADTPVETPAADEGGEGDHGAVETVEKDDTIETVAEDDDALDHRPVRRPSRARRYKIQEVIKVRQIMLVQVVKEERGNKGAALTTYLSLAGRYCVLMPNTARGGGISRKITNVVDRKKLKEIAGEMDVPEGAGLIIRTAGSQRTKSEIKRDYEYLQRLWEQIRELTLRSIAPAKIYEEGDIIKRSIRDLYSKEIDEVIVEGAEGYRNARDFMKMIMPSHARQVIPYQEDQPLFARHQVEGFLASMFSPTVQLPSGGYIVIGVTEALVAIDVNSGRATREGSIEQTALKTNLEASDEVARQLRLRDLAGLIVVDYIDMEERRNNAAVEKRLKDKLKTDRARIQVGRISGFGLLEMSRQRLRPGMIEATTQPCPHCHGTGLLRSDDNVALAILRQLDEEGVRGRSKEVLLRVPVGIMNYLMNHKREHVAGIEQRSGMAVRIEADLSLVSPDFAIERFRTATRAVPEPLPIVRASADLMGEEEVEDPEDEVEEVDDVEAEEAEAAPAGGRDAEATAAEDDRPRRKRRRRRRRRGERGDEALAGEQAAEDGDEEDGDDEPGEGAQADIAELMEVESAKMAPEEAASPSPVANPAQDEAPRRRTRTRTRRAPEEAVEAPAEPAPAPKRGRARAKPADEAAPPEAQAPEAAAPKRPRGRRRVEEPLPAAEAAPSAEPIPGPATMPVEDAMPRPEPMLDTTPAPQREPGGDAEPVAEREGEALEDQAASPAEAAPAPEEGAKPKRRGWWSLGRG